MNDPRLAAIALLLCACSATNAAMEDRHTVIPRTSKLCGPACAKVLLGLLDRDISVDDAVKAMPVREDGTSIAALAGFLGSQGLQTEMFRESANYLFSHSDPGIVRVWVDVGGPRAPHYVVVRRILPDRLIVVDPFARVTIYDRATFENIYLGDGVRVLLHGAPVRPFMTILLVACILLPNFFLFLIVVEVWRTRVMVQAEPSGESQA